MDAAEDGRFRGIYVIGLIEDCRRLGTGPQLSPLSLLTNISAARLSHQAIALGRLPIPSEFLPLDAVCNSYGKVMETSGPGLVRIGLPAEVLYQVIGWGLGSKASPQGLRDAALVVCAAFFGLRA